MSGRRIQLIVDASDDMENLRQQIFQREGINQDQQQILYNGIQLYDWVAFKDLYIQHGAVFFLAVRNRGG
jgi:hypothetical protein